MNRLGIIGEPHQETAMSSWVRGVVFDDFPSHKHALHLPRCDHPLRMGHLANRMRQKKNSSLSCFPYSGQDFCLVHHEYSTKFRLAVLARHTTRLRVSGPEWPGPRVLPSGSKLDAG